MKDAEEKEDDTAPQETIQHGEEDEEEKEEKPVNSNQKMKYALCVFV